MDINLTENGLKDNLKTANNHLVRALDKKLSKRDKDLLISEVIGIVSALYYMLEVSIPDTGDEKGE